MTDALPLPATRALSFGLQQVSVRFEQPVLEQLSLDVEPGEVLAVMGPSGSGKTTMLRLFNGMQRPELGRVTVGAEDLGAVSSGRLRQLRSQIGVISQDLGLVPKLRVLQNVLAGRLGRAGFLGGLRPLLFPRRREVQEVLALLDRLGIGDLLYQSVDTLSGGERQRVAIARALYQGARALLADEPFSALDPARASETLALLLRLAREDGLTLILAMHDLELARARVPRLVGLRAGRIVFDGPPERLESQALNELYRLPDGADAL